MARGTIEVLFTEHPALKRVLHECAFCHAIGLKPGILDTKHGDYGLRDSIRDKFAGLELNSSGLCESCA
ncbi:MAG: hypothetical protein V4710_15960, partial [Verrucomicrobiota bacterium]